MQNIHYKDIRPKTCQPDLKCGFRSNTNTEVKNHENAPFSSFPLQIYVTYYLDDVSISITLQPAFLVTPMLQFGACP